MIIHDLDVFGAPVRPSETCPELIIHADAVLPSPISSQGFQPFARRHTQVVQSPRDLQLPQLVACNDGDVCKSFNPFALGNSLCIEALKRPDHESMLMYCVINVKRDYCRHANGSSLSPLYPKVPLLRSEFYCLDPSLPNTTLCAGPVVDRLLQLAPPCPSTRELMGVSVSGTLP